MLVSGSAVEVVVSAGVRDWEVVCRDVSVPWVPWWPERLMVGVP